MDKFDKIQTLRRRVQKLEDEFVELAVDAESSQETEAFDLVAMELHDLDRTLFEAIFINNNSKIEKLITEISEATQAGERIRHQFKELRDAVAKAREAVQSAASYLGKANELMDEVDQITDLVTG